MLHITETEIKSRLALENPWWQTKETDRRYRQWPRRRLLTKLHKFVADSPVRRAVVLMGPRQVGKTVMMHQLVQALLDDGVPATTILYVSVDAPVYTGLALERLLGFFRDIHGHARQARLHVLFDEIQYHPDWERHLKSMVDAFPDIRFVVSGSAAAALRMKSRESGAGRFTDLLLPPLSFAEFLEFRGSSDNVIDPETGLSRNLRTFNTLFVDYINYGGFPEAAMEPAVGRDMQRFIAEDIVDKVLLRDLPSLYGISDQQELKRLFSVLAYNTGQEVNLEALSRASQVAKNTLRKYLEYLEAAFLIRRLYRIDENGRRFRRQTHFKVYLINPSLRGALFGALDADDPNFGPLVETAIFAQYVNLALDELMTYARWPAGEVDFVLGEKRALGPRIAIEVKWSDRPFQRPSQELAAFVEFCRDKPGIRRRIVCSRTSRGERDVSGLMIEFHPAAELCLVAGIGLVEEALFVAPSSAAK